MKLITIIASVISINAYAYDCESISEYAKEVMTSRQNEASIVEVIKLADSDLKKGIVIEAYKTPAYTGDKWKKKAIKAFANDVATDCYAESM